jgi:hypothetical protein
MSLSTLACVWTFSHGLKQAPALAIIHEQPFPLPCYRRISDIGRISDISCAVSVFLNKFVHSRCIHIHLWCAGLTSVRNITNVCPIISKLSAPFLLILHFHFTTTIHLYQLTINLIWGKPVFPIKTESHYKILCRPSFHCTSTYPLPVFCKLLHFTSSASVTSYQKV